MANKITPEFLGDYEYPRDCRLSPDGKLVVYACRNFWVRKKSQSNIVASLWLATVGVPKSARKLTPGTANDASPKFSPNGKHIAFTSDRHTPGKTSAIYLLPIASGGEALPLTPETNEKGIGDFRFSPDGRSIAYYSADEKSEEKMKKEEKKDDPVVYGEWDFARLRVVSVESKKLKTLWQGEGQVGSCAWSLDGKKVAFLVLKGTETDDMFKGGSVRVLDVESGKAEKLCEIGFGGFGADFVWFGDRIYVKCAYEERSLVTSNAVRAIETKDGAEAKVLDFGVDNCAIGIKICGDEVVAYVAEGLSDALKVLEGKTVYSGNASIGRGWDALVNGDKTTVIFIKGSTNGGIDLYSVVDSTETKLTEHGKDFDKINIGTGKIISRKAPDGLRIDALLCTPTSLANKKGPHPTVIIAHGGPYARAAEGDDPFFNWVQWCLAQDYVVIIPAYRGGSGRGNVFAQAVKGKIDASYDDVILMTKKCIADGVSDEKRCAIAGWSQGGYMSYLAMTRDSTFHFTCAIAGAGISDWDTISVTSDLPSYEAALNGAAPWSITADQIHGRGPSPLYHMQDIQTPCLILHGAEDARAPVTQAWGFSRGLQAKGIPFEMVIYPREGHGFIMPLEYQHYVDMLERVKKFLAKHLKD